jgi:hypothetical protein
MPAAMGVVLVGLLLGFAQSSPAEAACGTNWTSKKEPPESILVLRTATGKVEEVGFKRYVAVVMASGEWPSSLPPALLEAGALAAKQYGWYYALKGNHRDGYRNGAGTCFDVRDDSNDQVYRPETSEPSEKQKAARDALWGLSLRKNGKFFLTGYRRGSATRCARDRDEWKLYARSAEDCAKRLGYDSIDILHAYYRPRLTKVWAPGTEPDAEAGPAPDEAARDSEETASAEPEPAPGPEAEATSDVDQAGLLRSLVDRLSGLFGGDDET